jgi:predicted house-cleaning noncanonical NTP pyrophosphatase (MazG superfamily)
MNKIQGENKNIQCFKVDKLTQDFSPNLMSESGIKVHQRVLQDAEYAKRLNDKLFEEAQEVVDAVNTEELKEELADVLEVLMAMAKLKGIEFSQILKAGEEKRSKKGGFDQRRYVDFVEVPQGNPILKYFEARPDKYPKIEKPLK